MKSEEVPVPTIPRTPAYKSVTKQPYILNGVNQGIMYNREVIQPGRPP